jgi:hypothetical protein
MKWSDKLVKTYLALLAVASIVTAAVAGWKWG